MVNSGEGKADIKAENSMVFRFVSLMVYFWQLIYGALNGSARQKTNQEDLDFGVAASWV
jgi:hypothetical protein